MPLSLTTHISALANSATAHTATQAAFAAQPSGGIAPGINLEKTPGAGPWVRVL
jgi:hypothetical protein